MPRLKAAVMVTLQGARLGATFLDKGNRSGHPACSYGLGYGPGLVLTNAFVSLRHLVGKSV